MNDLISRSELHNLPIYKFGVSMLSAEEYIKVSDIEKITTAYSIDKVVEELEIAKDKVASEDYCRSINDKEKCDGRDCFKCCAEYLIEIVKAGGIK